MIVFIATLAFVATLFGGVFALRLRDRLHVILGFSAGAVVAVAFFDLLPEALNLAGPTALSVAGLGFMLYLAADRLLVAHGHAGDAPGEHRGVAGASALSLHSLLDGIGIGLAFQVSPAVGAIVTAAVLTHDFSDGINTVNMVVKNGGSRKVALRWLVLDALAPVIGVGLTFLFTIPVATLGLLLALFAGFFLYIGASDLIPESHHAHPTLVTTVMTIAGAVVLYIVIRIVG